MTKVLILGLSLVLLGSCGKLQDSETANAEETAQQVGDVVASIDEAGGSSGTLAMINHGAERTLKRHGYGPGTVDFLLPKAYAVTCGAGSFGNCSSNSIQRNFANCTVGEAVFSGTVTLTWGGNSSNCSLAAANDTITRVPNFTVTGRRGATLSVSKTGQVGQRLTWTSGSGNNKVFSFSNDGIRRVFTLPSGSVLFDHSTSTVQSITVSGTSRSNRTITAGTLRVANNVSGVTCDYTPSSVSWSSGCNCPVSGSWSANCSDGSTSTLTHTGCGTAEFDLGSESTTVEFDRCI
jgi:hypothetical protein